ncbi:MAG: hypothetical protein UT24_C0012G0122 [Candidatus Woesebacteria bacterium GW2011_GWB1_39_12]|uniref:Uncharacterized protein n=2 Tax=Candidatus Woeseibacteriota TaxID=1752722 RepID=A0A0G0MBR7_9BACT|nr:MAG: hypothetical protein UT23_C0008G0083 [Candidatus Woesebacteria bacterium GW2011_GWA1_39_12]KKR00500.1 MAG: hypothetical protein UT24_C0012G0122 [Candidatus Woesebacteria bacterium GW2011_GWB1_39_12]
MRLDSKEYQTSVEKRTWWRNEYFSVVPDLYEDTNNKDLKKHVAALLNIVRQFDWGGVYPIDYSRKGNAIYNFETGEFITLNTQGK